MFFDDKSNKSDRTNKSNKTNKSNRTNRSNWVYNESMNFALGYLAYRFVYRIGEFLRHWYVKSMRIYGNFVINRLEHLDYFFAWKITLKNLFQPLYKDYSLIGYILGFIFRALRLTIASFVYLIIFAAAILIYIIWLLTPVFLIVKIFL